MGVFTLAMLTNSVFYVLEQEIASFGVIFLVIMAASFVIPM
jgi:hypothetical protein